jgi:hypothetical protein
VAQVVERMSSKHEALSSTAKKIKNKKHTRKYNLNYNSNA